MKIIAIDPGKRGAIASTSDPNSPAAVTHHAMPDTIADLEAILRAQCSNEAAVAYVEHVQGFAGNNRPGFHMFALGENFGALQGILAAHAIRTVLVRPQKWQKFYGLGTRSACKSDNQWKNKLKAEAQRRFPNLTVTLAAADALLLLDYAIRQERGSGLIKIGEASSSRFCPLARRDKEAYPQRSATEEQQSRRVKAAEIVHRDL